MSLDSPQLMLLVAGVTVVGFVSAAAFGHRSAPTVRGFVSRLVVLVVLAALVLLTAAVYLNRTFHFYADWGDLFGSSASSAVETEQSGGAATNAVDQPVGPTSGSSPTAAPAPTTSRPPLPSPGKRQQVFQISGQASGLNGRVLVLLPKGYEDPGNAGRLYPVVMALQGFPGYPEQYLPGNIDLGGSIDAKVDAGLMAPAIVVAPATTFPNGNTDTECVNGRSGQPQVETYLSQDVPRWVAATLRARPGRAAMSAFGFSAGGYCAALLSMYHPDVFATAIVFGGYFTPFFESASYKPYTAADPEWKNRYDLVAAVQRIAPPIAMYVETSKADTLSYGTTAPFLAAVRAPMSVKTNIVEGVGHRIDIWDKMTPSSLDWLAATSREFRP